MKNNNLKIIFIIFIVINLLLITKVQAIMKNNNPLLREIKIDGQAIEPEFDQFITDYVIAIGEDKDSINIEAITDDPNATVEIIGDTNLKSGINDFEIKVTAEDGVTTNSYYLHITKGNQEKANANLESLEVEGIQLNPEFNNKDINYLVEYEGYIEKLNIIATPQNKNAKIEILNNDNFSSTLHIVTVKVIAEDGITTKEYKLTAKKAGEDVENPSGLEDYEADMENYQQEEKMKDNYSYMVYIGIVFLVLIVVIILVILTKKGKRKLEK